MLESYLQSSCLPRFEVNILKAVHDMNITSRLNLIFCEYLHFEALEFTGQQRTEIIRMVIDLVNYLYERLSTLFCLTSKLSRIDICLTSSNKCSIFTILQLFLTPINPDLCFPYLTNTPRVIELRILRFLASVMGMANRGGRAVRQGYL